MVRHTPVARIERTSGATSVMQYFLTFSVSLTEQSTASEEATIASESFFNELRLRFPDKSINPKWFQIRVSYKEAIATRLFEEIKEHNGKSPVGDLHFACANPINFYSVKVERIPSQEELNQSRWLYLTVPELAIAKFKSVEPDDSYVISKVSSKKKIAFGSTHTVGWMLLYSAALKDLLLNRGLQHVDFRTVKLEDGSASGLWQSTSDVVMPPLAMTLLDGRRQPFTGDYSKGCGLDDGNYMPMVLRYRESDLVNLPDFDLALSAERLGWTSHNVHRMHIISQRFRQVAEKLAPGQFKYGLVAVGEGEELQTRYTIPELAPPRDVA